MKKIILLINLLACYYFSFAQNASITGAIIDTINQQIVVNASVSLLRQKDSIVYKSTQSDTKGIFALNNLLSGNYLLLITHLNYENYIEHLQLNSTSQIKIGTIIMTLKPIVLKEIQVRKKLSAIKIKGDTTEFNADNFKVHEGASVEELLKKLPGIQVDNNGIITAMGEKVSKVFVDGQEFFGDNPTIATKNLQADAIYKIQVFYKKSDQATFTGIDDGNQSKTINLQLKEDKKKGSFGKLNLGSGLNDKWNNKATINSFRKKIQVSAYGNMNSFDRTGIDLQQSNYFTSDNDPWLNSNLGVFTSLSSNDNGFNNSFSFRDGVPKSLSGGLNYSNKFYDDQQSINGSYQYNKFSSEGYGNTFSQVVLPDTIFFKRESDMNFNSRRKHCYNGTYEWQVDSTTSLKIKTVGYKSGSNNINNFIGESHNEFGSVVNNSMRNTKSNGNDQSLQSSFLIRKKFKKVGRTISFNLAQNYYENKSDGFLYSLNSFFNKNVNIVLRDTTDQKKVNEVVINTFNGKIIFTEPLSKKLFVELAYAFLNNKSDALRLSFNKDVNGKYKFINNLFSNHYNFNVFSNLAGVAFKYNGKKMTFSFGSDIAKLNFTQKDLLADTILKRDFTNFFPKTNFVYKFNKSGYLSIIYNGQTKQPSIKQIQPASDNSNPLSIIIGNALLKQEFDHSINFNLNYFNLLSQRGISLFGSFLLQTNAIVTNNFTDTVGRTVYKFVNANGNYNYTSGFNYFINFEKLNINLNAGLDFYKSNFSNVVNNKKSVTDNSSIAINIGINQDKENRYNFFYNGIIRYKILSSSLTKSLQTKYWTQDHSFGLTVMLPRKFELNNELQGSLQQRTALFNGNNNVLLWNTYFGKKFLKNDKGIIKIIAHDILNQNIGYSRYINTNVIEETNYQSIARYFLLSVLLSF